MDFEANGFFVCVCVSDKALVFFEAFHVRLVFFNAILVVIIGVHFHFLGVSPLETHLGIISLLIVATIVYIIANLVIKVQPQDADAAYRFIFGLVCLVSGIFSAELLLALIISPLRLFMFDLCLILTFGVLHHWYRGIYEGLYKTADKVLKAVHILYNKIYGLLCWMYGRLLQILSFWCNFFKGRRHWDAAGSNSGFSGLIL